MRLPINWGVKAAFRATILECRVARLTLTKKYGMAHSWPEVADLKTRLDEIRRASANPGTSELVVEFSGRGYRFASISYATSSQFADGEGARIHGGRFTPRSGPRTVYVALERHTAYEELEASLEYFQLLASTFTPRVFAAIAIHADVILDLTCPETLVALGISQHQIAEEWRHLSASKVAGTQVFGLLVFEAGFEGILYPSVRRAEGRNLALFPDGLRETSYVLPLDLA